MTDRPKVLLVYDAADREPALQLAEGLGTAGVDAVLPAEEIEPGESLAGLLDAGLSACGYLFVLLSPAALESAWVATELRAALAGDLSQRAVTVLPVVVKPCRLPGDLAERVVADLSRNFGRGVQSIRRMIAAIEKLDLASLPPDRFEHMVVDLLKTLHFKPLRSVRGADAGYDVVCKLSQRNVFGRQENETWFVDIKQSLSTGTLRPLAQFAATLTLFPEPKHGLFVTADQLTMPARTWLNTTQSRGTGRLTVLEGTDLKRLLIGREQLVDRYFGKAAA